MFSLMNIDRPCLFRLMKENDEYASSDKLLSRELKMNGAIEHIRVRHDRLN